MTVVFFGTSAFGLPSLEAIAGSHHTLKAIVSTPDKPQGRNLKVQASPIKRWAVDRSIHYLDFSKDHPSEILSALKKLNADVFVVISFGVILKKEVLGLPRLMPLNVHASLLPKYRGATPMQAAIIHQDAETGVTVIKMAEKLDAGDILLKKKTPLSRDETIETLEKRLSVLAAESVLEALDAVEKGRVTLTPQNENKVSLTQKIVKNDGKIDWNESADRIHAKLHAYLGWPGSFFFFRGKRIVLCEAHPAPVSRAAAAGTVLEASAENGIFVAAGEKTALKLEKLQLEGRQTLPWKEFIRGFPIESGDVLE